MKTAVLALFAIAISPALAEKPNARSADFAITVHVVYSRSVNGVGQEIETLINGQKVELSFDGNGVLAPGDYPARISPSVHFPNSHPNGYDIYLGYDLLMPDGKYRTYTVIGLGPAANPQPTNP